MSFYQTLRYWSPTTGGDVVRVSMAGPDGQEFFMTITAADGPAYREARDRAVEAIETAISLKLAPGEVRFK